jgi:uncharacterized protein (TIGR02217 family)
MGYHNVLFPTVQSYGSTGAPGTSTSVIEMGSGVDQAVARWNGAKHRYNAKHNIKTLDDLYAVKVFALGREGPANTFPYKDWLDYATTSIGRTFTLQGVPVAVTENDTLIGTGDGTTTDFQLSKTYTSGAQVRVRNITKPVPGTVLVALDGVNQTTGWTVNALTGIVTFTTAPGNGVLVTAGFEFYVPVRFGKEIDQDGLQAAINDFSVGAIPDIPLVEDISGTQITDERCMGDSEPLAFGADITLGASIMFKVLQPSTSGLNAKLPDAADLPDGTPWFTLANDGVDNVQIQYEDGTNAFVLVAGDVLTVALATVGGVKTWYGY